MLDPKNVQKLTDNLIFVPVEEVQRADPALILGHQHYTYFRGCPGGAVFIRKRAAELSQGDVETLNKLCDERERPLNRRVKKLLAESLRQYFGEMAFHVYEFGCGKFPIASYFTQRSQFSYHGIERDRGYIAALHKMNIPASDWVSVMSRCATPQDRPSICVAVYALHFMVNTKLARRISHLTNPLGFFVGNFYADPNERSTGEQRGKLGSILKAANMSYITLEDPRARTNQFWVICPSGNVSGLHRYAEVLESNLGRKQEAAPRP